MKRFFIGVMIVAMMFLATPTPARAATIAELQAMIASLTAQLNVLLAKQAPTQVTQSVRATQMTGTSTGLVSFVEKPTLKLVYDRNKSESKLEATAIVNVDVGAEDILIGQLELAIVDSEGRYFSTKGQTRSITVIEGATLSQDPSVRAWLIKAGTKGRFKVTTTENPQMLFAGSYTTALYPTYIIIKDVEGNLSKSEIAYENTKSLPVTIVGEKSPYISGFEFKSSSVILAGTKFSKGDKVYVNGVKKGVLTDVNGGYAAFPASWLPKVVDAIGYCYVGGPIQIENPKTGMSNNYWVSKECGDGKVLSVPATIVNDTVFSTNNDAFVKLSIKGYDTNKQVDHWVLGYTCFEGVTLDSGKYPMLCDGINTGKNSLTFYRNNIYDVTQDYLMLTAGAMNKSSTGVNLLFVLEARDSADKTMGRDDKTIFLEGSTIVTPSTSVDLKVNGSSNPSEVEYGSQFQLSWEAQGLVGGTCSISGHHIPVVGGGLTTDRINEKTSGSLTLEARHSNYGYITPLEITIRCSDDTGKSTQDTIKIPVKQTPPTTTPSITVLSPNGGENLVFGSNILIRWAAKGTVTDKISLILDYMTPNSSGGYNISGSIANTGEYTWKVPNDMYGASNILKDYGKYYRIRACYLNSDNSTVGACDDSDSSFTITSHTVATTTTQIYQPRPRVVVPTTSRAEQLSSIANVLQAIKDMLKGM